MNKLVYLAGPITGLTFDEAVDWRTTAVEKLNKRGIRAVSPLRGKDFLREVGRLEGGNEYSANPISSARGITTRDRYDVMRADAILMNLMCAERVSIGTMIELGWADAARVPVVLVMEDGNLHEHAMVLETVGYRVQSLEAGVDVVRWLFADDL